MAENNLSYPIGEFDKNIELTAELRKENIQAVKDLPEKLAQAVEGLTDE